MQTVNVLQNALLAEPGSVTECSLKKDGREKMKMRSRHLDVLKIKTRAERKRSEFMYAIVQKLVTQRFCRMYKLAT